MSNLMISVAGIRGIIAESITPDLFAKMAAAFGSFRGGNKAKIILGMDTRISGEMIRYAVYSGLLSVGCEIIDIGICATPTVGIQIRRQKAQGGIMLSASHNPVQWNALKLMWEDGIFMDAEMGNQFLEIFHQNKIKYSDVFHLGKIIPYPTATREHQDLVIAHVDYDLINRRKFKVAYDPCNGSGGVIIPDLLKKLGCEVFTINEEPNGRFAHPPEPLPENLKDLCTLVKEKKANLGIATDPDVDRVAFVSEKGEPIGEENGLALIVDFILGKEKEHRKNPNQPPSAAVNMSTTRAIEDMAQKHGAIVFRTKIGEANVARTMIKEPNCLIGGEGNGGVIYPPTHYGRDAAIGIGLMLEYLVKSGKTISQLANELPKYYIVKDKIVLKKEQIPVLLEKVKQSYSKETIDTLDGVKVNFKDSWVHVRPSGTEPILRIIAEAKSIATAQSLCQDIRKMI